MQPSFSWQSELPYGEDIQLTADPAGNWVERWHLVSSPIWSVKLDGLTPVFEAKGDVLAPVWQPWPGESAGIDLEKPNAITGELVTIQQAIHRLQLGGRRRLNQLTLAIDCSLAGETTIGLDSGSEITSLESDGQAIPVQFDRETLVIPTKPGSQSVAIKWKTADRLETVSHANPITLPYPAANVTREISIPENRWVLWADGPRRGPAVRFWVILIVALLAALALGSVPHSPLRRIEWVLLVIGLTQVPLLASMTVVGWLFLLAWRGRNGDSISGRFSSNLLQIIIVLLTSISLIVLIAVVGAGLLGNPNMFIIGNGSTSSLLRWIQPSIESQLPDASVVSVSVWYYRFLMLCWALWLATALIRWLTWGWQQFSANGAWRGRRFGTLSPGGGNVARDG